MIILLNKYSNGSCGLKKWASLKSDLESQYIGGGYSMILDFAEFQRNFNKACNSGERKFVAAGGDGTVNFLLNQMMQVERPRRRQMTLGAIGLGSSNDFHKRFSKNENGRVNGKTPIRLDFDNAVRHNVGLIEYEDIDFHWRRKYFLVNCSVGLIAQANYFFNSENTIVNWLKPRWVEGTIWFAALETLFTAKNIPTWIQVEKENLETPLTTMSVFINPNVSGSFHFDFEISPQSDYLGVGLCERMGLLARIRTILALSQGKFAGLPKTRTWRAREIEIYPAVPIALETDGEVTLSRRLKIKLLPKALRVCR